MEYYTLMAALIEKKYLMNSTPWKIDTCGFLKKSMPDMRLESKNENFHN